MTEITLSAGGGSTTVDVNIEVENMYDVLNIMEDVVIAGTELHRMHVEQLTIDALTALYADVHTEMQSVADDEVDI